MTNAEAWFSIALRPRKPEGSLGRTAQDGHLDSHTAPELLKARFVIGPPNILSGSVHVCTFEPGDFTGWGSGGVKQDLPGNAFKPVHFCTFVNDTCLVLLTSAHGAGLASRVSLKCLKTCL